MGIVSWLFGKMVTGAVTGVQKSIIEDRLKGLGYHKNWRGQWVDQNGKPAPPSAFNYNPE